MEEGKGWKKSSSVSFLSQTQVYAALLWNFYGSYKHQIKVSLLSDFYFGPLNIAKTDAVHMMEQVFFKYKYQFCLLMHCFSILIVSIVDIDLCAAFGINLWCFQINIYLLILENSLFCSSGNAEVHLQFPLFTLSIASVRK